MIMVVIFSFRRANESCLSRVGDQCGKKFLPVKFVTFPFVEKCPCSPVLRTMLNFFYSISWLSEMGNKKMEISGKKDADDSERNRKKDPRRLRSTRGLPAQGSEKGRFWIPPPNVAAHLDTPARPRT